MTLPIRLTPESDEDQAFEAWKKQQQGGTDDGAAFRAWKAKNVATARPDATSALPRNRDNPTGDAESVGGVPANLALIGSSVFPGAILAQAGARALARGQSFSDALNDIDVATDKIPGPVQVADQAVGAAVGLAPGITAYLAGKVATQREAEQRVATLLEKRAPKSLLQGTPKALREAVDVGQQMESPIQTAMRAANDAGPPPSSIEKLQAVIAKLRAEQPGEELGNQWGDAEEAMGTAPHQKQAIVDQVKPQPPNIAAYLQARMRNPSLPRVPTPEVLHALGLAP